MNRIKFTQGPWRVHRPSEGMDKNWHVTDEGDTFVAHVYGFNHAVNEQSRLNAQLIAVAPEMYELLSELIDIEGPQPGTQTWANKVMAVLAKTCE